MVDECLRLFSKCAELDPCKTAWKKTVSTHLSNFIAGLAKEIGPPYHGSFSHIVVTV